MTCKIADAHARSLDYLKVSESPRKETMGQGSFKEARNDVQNLIKKKEKYFFWKQTK